MSTRSQIAFYRVEPKTKSQVLKKWDALIYRHYDGYPEGVMPELMPVIREFAEGRGLSDTEYASAYLVSKWKKDFLNIGVSKDFHGDIEYLYCVYPPCEVKCFAVEYGEPNTLKLEPIDLKEYEAD